MQDDVLLSPRVNEENIFDIFKITSNSGFIGEFLNEAPDIAAWGFWPGSLWRFQFPKNLLSGTGVESWEAMKLALPPYADAKQKLARFGVGPITLVRSDDTEQPIFYHNPFGSGILQSEITTFYRDVLKFLVPEGSLTLDYPFVTAGPYSDFYILPKSSLAKFSHICGVLSAAGMFTEITVPTALALSVTDIVFKKDAEIELDWVEQARSSQVVLNMLKSNPRLMAVHPVKLSRQSDDFIETIANASAFSS